MLGAPYDFDIAGVVDAKYAKPDGGLPIRRVTDRLFRGWCRSAAELQPTLDYFNEKKAEIYAVYDEVAALEPEQRMKTSEYFDKFYEIINDSGKIEKEMVKSCRDPATGLQRK